MQLTTGLPLLFALGARVFINAIVPDPTHTPSTPDFLLNGLFQGVLVHNTLTQIPQAVVVVAVGVAAKLVIDFVRLADVVQTACTVLGVALGVLLTDLLAQFVDGTPGLGFGAESVVAVRPPVVLAAREPPPDPPKRIRLVSFGRDRTRSQRHREREKEREREREREREWMRKMQAGAPPPHARAASRSSMHRERGVAGYVTARATGHRGEQNHGDRYSMESLSPLPCRYATEWRD